MLEVKVITIGLGFLSTHAGEEETNSKSSGVHDRDRFEDGEREREREREREGGRETHHSTTVSIVVEALIPIERLCRWWL